MGLVFLHKSRNVFKMRICDIINYRGVKRKEYRILEFGGFVWDFLLVLSGWLFFFFFLVHQSRTTV